MLLRCSFNISQVGIGCLSTPWNQEEEQSISDVYALQSMRKTYRQTHSIDITERRAKAICFQETPLHAIRTPLGL